MNATLGEQLARREERAFAGRKAEQARLTALLEPGSPFSAGFVHGPAGIGKSTLIRRVARIAERRGWHAHDVEGRALVPSPDALEDLLVPAREDPRPLVVLDSYERMTALGAYLRRSLLPSLPETAVVLIASRQPPEGAWFAEGWQSAMVSVELGPLSREEAAQLLKAHGVAGAREVEAALRWCGGSPLALALAAEGARVRPPDRRGPAPLGPAELRALVGRLVEDEFDSARAAVLEVAAIARVSTPELLGDAVPGVDAEQAYRWLEGRSFAEPLGDGLTLHELVGRAVREDLRARDPERERELRRRIADHLYRRATAGDRLVIVDLAHLATSRAFRWGFAWNDSSRYRIDDPRPGDREAIDAALRGTRHAGCWEGSARFFTEAPEHVAVVRDAEERVAGYGIAVTPASAPGFCGDDPVLAPWLDHASRLAPHGEAVLYRDSVDLTREPDSGVIGMLGMAGMLRSALENPRFAYLPINPSLPGALEFAAAAGGRHLPELDVRVGAVELRCYLIEYGPGGLLAAQRDLVYRELGLPPPPAADAGAGIDFATVRDALLNLDSPALLARSPLASGSDPDERAASVRQALDDACERAFGSSQGERLLRDVLIRAYIRPAPSHELAAQELHLSRSAYFRRLRAATARVADYLEQRRARA